MPVPKDVSNGQTVEIRITIQRSGNYQNTQYYSSAIFNLTVQGTFRYYDESTVSAERFIPVANGTVQAVLYFGIHRITIL